MAGFAVWSVVAAGGVLCPLWPLSPVAEPAGGCVPGAVVVVLCVFVVLVVWLPGFCDVLELAACPPLLHVSATLLMVETAMLPSLVCVP